MVISLHKGGVVISLHKGGCTPPCPPHLNADWPPPPTIGPRPHQGHPQCVHLLKLCLVSLHPSDRGPPAAIESGCHFVTEHPCQQCLASRAGSNRGVWVGGVHGWAGCVGGWGMLVMGGVCW